MIKQHRVLFISAPIGAGHLRAAQAVKKALEIYGDTEIESRIANIFDFFHPSIGKMILSVYLKILKVFPQAYGAAYGWGNTSSLALLGRELVSRFLAGRMHRYIEKYNPSIIVCTHATPAGLIAYLLRKEKIHVPAVAVVTDYVVHRLWIYPEIHQYIVANSHLKEILCREGIQESKIQCMGIPVDVQFTQPVDHRAVLEKLSLQPFHSTLLIMGGGAGLLPMDNILEIVNRLDYPLQVLVITGNNKEMYCRLKKCQYKHPTRIFGYVDNVHELMSISDLIITKPGGLTAAEALSKGLPMLIYRPIPGQEEANTRQLLQLGAAVQADTLCQLETRLVELLINNPQDLKRLSENAAAAGRANSALLVSQYIISLLEKLND